MPRTTRFHLDENAHRAIAEGLRRRGIDVTTTPEAGLLTATDEQQAAYCLAEGRVLFTQDRDFLRLHAAGFSHAGIAYCDNGTRSIGEIIQGLVMIWEILEPQEIANRVEYL
jgi:predicted nuclease of predicted toxin-antitoxin system